MKPPSRHHRVKSPLLSGLLLAILLALPLQAARAEVYAIFVHKSVALDNVSTRQLARLFLSEVSGIGSTRLYPVNLADDDQKLAFYETLTGMPRERVAYHFVESELRGEGTWPREVLSELEIIKMMLVSRKVVAWMSWTQYQNLADTLRRNLKLVAVDGHLPADADYPLTTIPNH